MGEGEVRRLVGGVVEWVRGEVRRGEEDGDGEGEGDGMGSARARL